MAIYKEDEDGLFNGYYIMVRDKDNKVGVASYFYKDDEYIDEVLDIRLHETIKHSATYIEVRTTTHYKGDVYEFNIFL